MVAPTSSLDRVIAGSNDNRDLFDVYRAVTGSNSEPVAAFCFAWEILNFVGSDGLEKLCEQPWNWIEFRDALVEVGLVGLDPLFHQLEIMVPPTLREPQCEEQMMATIEERFDDFKRLNELFWDSTAQADEILGAFIRSHAASFAKSNENR